MSVYTFLPVDHAQVLPSTGLGMKAAGILALMGCLVTVVEPKIYTRCKLAKIFSRASLDNYRGFSLGNWICMAYYESHYNTTAQTQLKDGSIDYGIFQINSYTWCRNTKLQEKNRCHVACSALMTDDLTDAIICAKKIVKETDGMNYWCSFQLKVKRECMSLSYTSGNQKFTLSSVNELNKVPGLETNGTSCYVKVRKPEKSIERPFRLSTPESKYV
ncbi:hypothetical protein MG293_011475 [Ovis ammon polii]|uniref:Glycosyl hydrolases family 22 (GH22) domain-containing protein n=1 Tax=Ovis ammon polii TaxID=230172 RepID=A0AAD4U4D2_OVIAM|nr:hypothetical protein MG293_011475 [Ovis ammon polii]